MALSCPGGAGGGVMPSSPPGMGFFESPPSFSGDGEGGEGGGGGRLAMSGPGGGKGGGEDLELLARELLEAEVDIYSKHSELVNHSIQEGMLSNIRNFPRFKVG